MQIYTDHMDSFVSNNIVHNVSYWMYWNKQSLKSDLHVADLNCVSAIANGTSSMFHKDLISYLYTNSKPVF